jgi:hypothetical protein
MTIKASLPVATRAFAMGVLLALSLPGVQVAQAQSAEVADIAPSADQLFGLGAAPAKGAPATLTGDQGASCRVGAPSGSALPSIAPTDAFHVMAQLADLGGEGRMLNGRGYNYPSGLTQWHRLQRIQLEAARQEAAAQR